MTKAIWKARVFAALLGLGALAAPLPASAQSEPVPGVDPDQTLSEQLNKNKGVIEPPPIGDEEIHVPAPDPTPGTTPVIPPPGTPGGDPSVEPK
jgi:hypothetical protein